MGLLSVLTFFTFSNLENKEASFIIFSVVNMIIFLDGVAKFYYLGINFIFTIY